MPGPISKRVVSDRLAWVARMVGEIRSLPLDDRQLFFSDKRNIWTAESCLRLCRCRRCELFSHSPSK